MGVKENCLESKECNWCGELQTSIYCGKCEDVWYCCKEHQREDWSEHSCLCKAYRMKSSPEVGQYLVATRQLKAGSVVLRDAPVAIGPMGTSDLICLSCHKDIIKEDFFKCPDCGWPMCSLRCACKPCHEDECDILSNDHKRCGAPQTTGSTPRYDLILLLRCLLLKKKNPRAYGVVRSMASHGKEKKMEGDPYQTAAVRYLKEICKVDFEEDEIHHIRGVILANVIDIRGPGGSHLRALYPEIRLMNHSCKPNIQLSADENGVMEARTAVKVEKGMELTISYTEIDVPLNERRACLLSAHYFICACERCTDPTECDTFFSNCRCPQCPHEILQPLKKNNNITWYCRSCKSEATDEEINQEVGEWMFRLEMNDLFGTGTPLKITSALGLVKRNFHDKHYVYLKACQLALRKLAYNDTLSAVTLKKHLWEQLLDLFSHFEPGYTRRRGMILSELGYATYTLAKVGSATGELSPQQVRRHLQDSHDIFLQSYRILQLEPKGTLEYSLFLTVSIKIDAIGAEISSIVV